MRKPVLFLSAFLCLLLSYYGGFSQNQQEEILTTYKTDLSFNCVTVDSSGNVWAGTSGKGLWKLEKAKNYNAKNASGYVIFARVIIRGLAADRNGGIWVAHEGFNGSTATLGGVDHFPNGNDPLTRKHYFAISRVGASNDPGLPSRRTEGIAIDKSGTVWTTSSYNDLTCSGCSPSYVVNPGGVAFKTPSMNTFDTVDQLLPYPAYTINTPPSQTAGTRICIGLGIDHKNNEVWAGVAQYNAGSYQQGTRIARYDMSGNFIGQIDENNSLLPLGTHGNARVMSIYFDTARNRAWLGFNLDRGIAVKGEDDEYLFIGKPSVFPASTIVNQNAITGKPNGEIFIGTNNGLFVYKGKGDFSNDTSWRVYNTTNGLPSNSVTGITVEKSGTVWVSTAAGIVRMQRGDFWVYNLKSHLPLDPGEYDYLSMAHVPYRRRIVAQYNTNDPQDVIDRDTLLMAADDVTATVFKYSGDAPETVKLRIKEDPNGANPNEYGSIHYRFQTADSLVILYKHPKIISAIHSQTPGNEGTAATLELVNETSGEVVFSKKIRFVLPPVLLVHGIWSRGNVWEPMKDHLTKNNSFYHYKDFQIGTPSYPNDRHFADNFGYIPGFIQELLTTCAGNGLSAGRVDVVVHSMGGILTRMYLQESGQKYRDNIHKFITLNTPHSGSPWANIVHDTKGVAGLMWLISKIPPGDFNPYNGALDDLRLLQDSDPNAGLPIDQDLNGTLLNKNKVPSFVIHTIDDIPWGVEVGNEILNQFIKKGIPTTIVNVVPGGAGGRSNQYILAARALLGALKWYLLKNTPCPSTSGTVKECLTKIFNGPNDWVVSDVSQRGGITGAEWQATNANHLNVHSILPVQNKVLDLLREANISSAFTQNGFHPDRLKWNPATGTTNARTPGSLAANGTVQIISPAPGTSYLPGDIVSVTVRRTGAINRLFFGWATTDETDAMGILDQDSIFTFRVPATAVGQLRFSTIGFDNNNNEAADSSFINIQLSPSITLDSIKVIRDQNNRLSTPLYDSTAINVLGYYSDTVRTITGLSGITYTFDAGGVASITSSNYLKGLSTGNDLLFVSYQGLSDTVLVEVTDSVPRVIPGTPLPVHLSSFTGRFVNEQVELNWITAQEINNKEFEVEYSTNGSDFETIGTVAGKGNSDRINYYRYSTPHFINGKNYYRLKQVDFDGNFKHSSIVTISVDRERQSVLSMAPNPASTKIVLSIQQPVNDQLRLVLNNITGQQVWSTIVPGNSTTQTIYLPSLSKGVYVASIINAKGEKIFYNKLIIQ